VDASLVEAARRVARRYRTPLYLYDLPRLDADARRVAAAFPDPWLRLYALKANGLPPLIERLPAMGFGATAVSSGELDLARRAGFPGRLTALEGIGKGTMELRRAARSALSDAPFLWVSLESADEAAELARLAEGQPGQIDVLVRVNPGVSPETWQGLAVGAVDSKFGVLPDEIEALIEAGGGPHGPLRWRGIHIHVGSQLGAVDAWRSAFRLGLRLLSLQRAGLPDFDTLCAGSGFPVDYGADGTVPGPERFAEEAAAELEALPEDVRPSRLGIEPGRAVVAGCGWLVARVLHVRERDSGRLIVLDSGMTELIRPSLYGAEHPIRALTSHGRPAGEVGEPLSLVRVDGPICESTDRLGTAELPPLTRGDTVAIGVAGAYGSSMASSYNGRPRPPEIAWDGDRTVVLRRRRRLATLP
jgi:diaminopimelate decarboxylase